MDMNDNGNQPTPTLRIAVCEDDDAFLRDIETALEREMARRQREYSLARHRDAESFLDAFAAGTVDLALLDIALPGMDGMELARRIRREDDDCGIVFITSSRDHAIAGYEVAAAGYLLKPISETQLAAALDRCLADAPPSRRSVLFQTTRGERRVNPDRISHVESKGRRTIVYTADGDFAVYAKLAETLALLPEHFIQVHKSFAVNPERVTRDGADAMQTEDGRRISVSRTYRKAAEARYLAYLARGL